MRGLSPSHSSLSMPSLVVPPLFEPDGSAAEVPPRRFDFTGPRLASHHHAGRRAGVDATFANVYGSASAAGKRTSGASASPPHSSRDAARARRSAGAGKGAVGVPGGLSPAPIRRAGVRWSGLAANATSMLGRTAAAIASAGGKVAAAALGGDPASRRRRTLSPTAAVSGAVSPHALATRCSLLCAEAAAMIGSIPAATLAR